MTEAPIWIVALKTPKGWAALVNDENVAPVFESSVKAEALLYMLPVKHGRIVGFMTTEELDAYIEDHGGAKLEGFNLSALTVETDHRVKAARQIH